MKISKEVEINGLRVVVTHDFDLKVFDHTDDPVLSMQLHDYHLTWTIDIEDWSSSNTAVGEAFVAALPIIEMLEQLHLWQGRSSPYVIFKRSEFNDYAWEIVVEYVRERQREGMSIKDISHRCAFRTELVEEILDNKE